MDENMNLSEETEKEIIDKNQDMEKTEYVGKIGFGIASMVCGIVALVLCCVGWISIPVGIVGLVLGCVAVAKKYAGHGMAVAGIVCSVIALVLYVLALLLGAGTWAAILSSLG